MGNHQLIPWFSNMQQLGHGLILWIYYHQCVFTLVKASWPSATASHDHNLVAWNAVARQSTSMLGCIMNQMKMSSNGHNGDVAKELLELLFRALHETLCHWFAFLQVNSLPRERNAQVRPLECSSQWCQTGSGNWLVCLQVKSWLVVCCGMLLLWLGCHGWSQHIPAIPSIQIWDSWIQTFWTFWMVKTVWWWEMSIDNYPLTK